MASQDPFGRRDLREAIEGRKKLTGFKNLFSFERSKINRRVPSDFGTVKTLDMNRGSLQGFMTPNFNSFARIEATSLEVFTGRGTAREGR